MPRTVGELSAEELEQIVERVIDRRLRVWLEQMTDALSSEEDSAEMRPEFAEGLRRAIDQARSGEGMSLQSFREQTGR